MAYVHLCFSIYPESLVPDPLYKVPTPSLEPGGLLLGAGSDSTTLRFTVLSSLLSTYWLGQIALELRFWEICLLSFFMNLLVVFILVFLGGHIPDFQSSPHQFSSVFFFFTLWECTIFNFLLRLLFLLILFLSDYYVKLIFLFWCHRILLFGDTDILWSSQFCFLARLPVGCMCVLPSLFL